MSSTRLILDRPGTFSSVARWNSSAADRPVMMFSRSLSPHARRDGLRPCCAPVVAGHAGGSGVRREASATAWRTKPAWTDVQRFGYRRASIAFVKTDSSHTVMVSHSDEVVSIILQAAEATK